MRFRFAAAVFIAVISVVLPGCYKKPIYNPRMDFPARDSKTVEDAILKALANRHWLAQKKAPGLVVATLNIRTHQAVIRIDYIDSAYSIQYVDSTNLRHSPPRWWYSEKIHSNYNGWIRYLVRDINTLLEIPAEP